MCVCVGVVFYSTHSLLCFLIKFFKSMIYLFPRRPQSNPVAIRSSLPIFSSTNLLPSSLPLEPNTLIRPLFKTDFVSIKHGLISSASQIDIPKPMEFMRSKLDFLPPVIFLKPLAVNGKLKSNGTMLLSMAAFCPTASGLNLTHQLVANKPDML